MRVVMLSTDRKLFEPGSAVAERMIEYGSVLGDLQLVVMAGRHEKITLSEHVTIHSTNSSSRWLYITDAIALIVKLNRQKKADWISAQDPFETGLAAFIANIFVKTKLQLQLHTDVFSPFFSKSSFFNQSRVVLAKFLLPRASGIRVVSQKIYESLTSGPLVLSPEKITVLPVFIDAEKFQAQEIKDNLKQKYSSFDQIILMASRLEPEKDFGTALQAFQYVLTQKPKTGLIIVGAGTLEKRINNLIQELGLTDNVVVLPWTTDLYSYYKTADIFLLTSLYEGYGRTLIEAAIAGLPFISTKVGCAEDLVDLGVAGSVVPVGDSRALSSVIVNFLDHERKQTENRLSESIHFLTKEQFLDRYLASFSFK